MADAETHDFFNDLTAVDPGVGQMGKLIAAHLALEQDINSSKGTPVTQQQYLDPTAKQGIGDEVGELRHRLVGALEKYKDAKEFPQKFIDAVTALGGPKAVEAAKNWLASCQKDGVEACASGNPPHPDAHPNTGDYRGQFATAMAQGRVGEILEALNKNFEALKGDPEKVEQILSKPVLYRPMSPDSPLLLP